jgi:hypothetical protein
MVAPIFIHFAAATGGGLDAGTAIALWIGLGLAVSGAIIGVIIYVVSGARPQTPDLDLFLAGLAPAWESPRLLARVRPRAVAPKVPAMAGATSEGTD